MNRQVLRMKYHPAKKEVTFSRIQSGKEIPVTGGDRSVLAKYINEKGRFVLQNKGEDFFRDIIEAFNGEEVANLEVTMTQKDYEDFIQMLDYFNKRSDIKINATKLAELPDMNATYDAVKKHGFDSIDILKQNRDSFHDVNSDNENVLTCIKNYTEKINKAAKSISDKIDTLEQNTVNVCFSGPFSSGKSLLINSLIGCAILPTDIRPETAAMFMISSPKPGDNVKIKFNINDAEESFSEIMWNEAEGMFLFVAGPQESDTRKKIQETMNVCKEKRQYEQLHDILSVLNTTKDVDRVINVSFPISMDTNKVKFMIYDTPGTDSGVYAHKHILKNALSAQTHSILVFVTYPNGLNGGGNRALLEYLSEIEQKEDKATIDLSRSLFVVNYADSLTKDGDFEAIRTGKISNKMDVEESEDEIGMDAKSVITIKLTDKKLFFTSAKFAYPAAAVQHGIATKSDEKLLKSGSAADVMNDDEFGKYYRQDRCATSEYATKQLTDKCEREFNEAKATGDLARQMWVASGLYALEEEIKEYGEKYASAVKAYAIIKGVDDALSQLDKEARSIERQNSDDIHRVEKEIEAIRSAISNGIAEAKKEREIGKNDPLPEEASITLFN